MARNATEIFVVRNWKYFVNPTYTDVFRREGYAHPLFQFKLSYDSVISDVSVSGEGNVAVKNSFIWDMGDGTLIEGVQAIHNYKKSGKYVVTCYFIDGNGNRIVNNFSVTLDIYDFVSNHINIEGFSTTPWVSDYNTFNIHASIDASNAPRIISDGGLIINLSYDKKTNPFLTYVSPLERDKLPFDHLIPSLKFFQKEENNDLTLTDSAILRARPVYFYLDANLDVVITEDINLSYNSTVVGIHSDGSFVFVSDETIDNPFNIWAAFEANQFSATDEEFLAKSRGKLEGIQAINLFAQGFSASNLTVNPNVSTGAYISFTSNGYDGYGVNENLSFDIFDIRFQGTPFPVVIKVKGVNKQSLLYLPKLNLPKFTGSETSYIQLLDQNNAAIDPSVYSVDYSLSDVTPSYVTGGYVRPIFTINSPFPNGVKIKAVYNDNGFSITTVSSIFNVYKASGQADVRKINENYIISQSIAEYRTQRVLIDKAESIFEAFIPAFTGDTTTNPLALGRSLYEKTANLVMNKHDIDSMLTDSISSLNQFFDGAPENIISSLSPELKRTLDIFSSQITTLYGSKVLISEDFADKGFVHQGFIGKNKGEQLDYNTAVLIPFNPNVSVTPGPNQFVVKKIIAYEKFSETYTVLNAYRLNEVSSVINLDFSPYSLRAAIPLQYKDKENPDGGFVGLPATGMAPSWPLVLSEFSTGVSGTTLQVISDTVPKFYDFFLYVESSLDNFDGGTVDFTNTNNELDESFLGTQQMNSLLRSTLAKNITSAINS